METTTEEKLRQAFVNHFQKYLSQLIGTGDKFRQDAEECVNDIMKIIGESNERVAERFQQTIQKYEIIIKKKKNGNRKKTTTKLGGAGDKMQ